MAEELGVAWLRYLGHQDARQTPGGADGGLDVVASKAAAQVKFEARQVGAPVVQRLYGAAANRYPSLHFFASTSYSVQAVTYADTTEICLWLYDMVGSIRPANRWARRAETDRRAEAERRAASIPPPDASPFLGDWGSGSAEDLLAEASPPPPAASPQPDAGETLDAAGSGAAEEPEPEPTEASPPGAGDVADRNAETATTEEEGSPGEPRRDWLPALAASASGGTGAAAAAMVGLSLGLGFPTGSPSPVLAVLAALGAVFVALMAVVLAFGAGAFAHRRGARARASMCIVGFVPLFGAGSAVDREAHNEVASWVGDVTMCGGIALGAFLALVVLLGWREERHAARPQG